MSVIAASSWLILFALALFAFAVGGGFFAYCMRASSNQVEAARRFQIYGWLFFPLATIAVGVLVWLRLEQPLSQLGMVAAPDFTGLVVGGVVGAMLIGLAELIGSWLSPAELDPETAAYMATELRELPSLVIVAPIGEELIFRGFGLVAFQGLGLFWAGMVTSLAFALMHFRPAMVLMGFIGGSLLFAVYAWSENLWVVILAHAIANLGSWLLMRRKVQQLSAG